MRNPVLEVIHAPRQADRTEVCDIHGEYTSRHIMARIWTRCPECAKAAAAKAETDRQEAEKAARDARWSRQLGESGIPLRFQDRTLPRFVAENDGQRYALQFAVDYAAEFEHGHSGRCAVFVGEPGTGKTHLACGIALRAMGKFGASALFTTVSKLSRRVREAKSFDADETESAAIRIFVYPDLLIVDEVGVQSGTDAEARALFDVINDRYEQRKPTIFLSNLDLGGVQAALGARVFDRMREDGGEVVSFTWGSHRGRIAA
ncbi:ATP-binding protein [Microvirgula aerodenitrificans]|uniref:ATP-binding protein n=1 Tax=Microvirgula aerodenitrificans TaxID=57480 RepID=UPI00248EF507|nr:ATP-binding protein [Microvirgula aerodenitrificans]